MWSLIFAIGGMGSMGAALGLLWATSPWARAAFGPSWVELAPRDIALVFRDMFGVGFLLTSGAFTETVFGRLGSILNGGMNRNTMGRMQESMGLMARVAWGLPAYAGMAGLFGFYAARVMGRVDVMSAAMDKDVLLMAGTWPYHLMALLTPWGLTPDKF